MSQLAITFLVAVLFSGFAGFVLCWSLFVKPRRPVEPRNFTGKPQEPDFLHYLDGHAVPLPSPRPVDDPYRRDFKFEFALRRQYNTLSGADRDSEVGKGMLALIRIYNQRNTVLE